MKILIVTNKIPIPIRDGGAFAVKAIIDGYLQLNHEVDVLTMLTHKHQATEKVPHYYETVFVDTKIKTVPFLKNLLFSKSPYNVQRFVSPQFEQQLTNSILKKEYDIIQLESLFLSPYIEHIRTISNAKIILRAHNVEHVIWQTLYNETKHLIKKWYFRILTKRIKNYELEVIQKVDGILSITEEDKRFFTQNSNTPVHNTPTGIHSTGTNETEKVIENSFFFIGSLDWIPNQQAISWFVKEVWPTIYKNHPEATFHIAGRGCPLNIAESFKKPGITFCGEVESASQFIASKNSMILPLFAGSGLRIRLLEVMNLEKAILTTTVGAKGMPVSSNKNILIADTKEEFIQAVNYAFDNPEKMACIAQNAKEFVRKFYDNLTICDTAIKFIVNLPSK